MIKKQGRQLIKDNTMIFLSGSKASFRCQCGCNIFNHFDPDIYECNACREEYVGS